MPSFRSFLLFAAVACLSAAVRMPTTFLTVTPTVTTLFPPPAPSASASTSAGPEPCSCAPPASTTSYTSCTKGTKGYLTCLDDGAHFVICANGKPTIPKPIAPGYKCRPGPGSRLEISRA